MTIHKTHDITLIGNAPVDVLHTNVPDRLLADHAIQKGIWQPVAVDTIEAITPHLGTPQLQPGGAAANTAYGLAQLGNRVSFVGALGNDAMGHHFHASMNTVGIAISAPSSPKPTLIIHTLISPDHERTFITTGENETLSRADISESAIAQSRLLLVEAYLLNNPDQRDAVFHATALARRHRIPVAFTLASHSVVRKQNVAVCQMIENGLDLLIGNEEEMAALEESSPDYILGIVSRTARLATHGKKGAHYISARGHRAFAPCPPLDSTKVLDTTGAGDAFLAGFLDGYLKNIPHALALAQGHRFARQVVQRVGARLPHLDPATVRAPAPERNDDRDRA